MHAQHWPRTQSRSRQGGAAPPLSFNVLSMHELSLSMPEPMLSLSMLILAKYPVADIRPRSKPKSKLTSPNFNMLTFGDFA